MTEGTLSNEEAAEFRTNIEGWVCKTCRRFYGNEPGAERTARYCCEKDHKCGTEGCENRAKKHWIYCDSCMAKHDLERYLKLEVVEWDGEVPLVVHDDDEFFFSADDLSDYLDREGVKLEDMCLVVAVEDPPRHFDLSDFLDDHLPDGLEPDDHTKLDAYVNRWIEKHVPKVWTAGKTRPSMESLRKYVTEPEESKDEA